MSSQPSALLPEIADYIHSLSRSFPMTGIPAQTSPENDGLFRLLLILKLTGRVHTVAVISASDSALREFLQAHFIQTALSDGPDLVLDISEDRSEPSPESFFSRLNRGTLVVQGPLTGQSGTGQNQRSASPDGFTGSFLPAGRGFWFAIKN